MPPLLVRHLISTDGPAMEPKRLSSAASWPGGGGGGSCCLPIPTRRPPEPQVRRIAGWRLLALVRPVRGATAAAIPMAHGGCSSRRRIIY